MKQRSKRVTAWILLLSLCLAPFWVPGTTAWAAEDAETERGDIVLRSPVIDAESGKVLWDSIYFGNYWQSKYITQPENEPEQGEDDVEHVDTDGTKYLVREDKTCYKYEPIKWRVLSVSKDGRDAFLMADKNLDVQPYHNAYSDAVTWENASVRTWLNEDFLNRAFTEEEQEGIIPTEIDNKKSPEYVKAEDEEEEVSTTDRIYLLSREEVTSRAYGFTDNTGETESREVANTDFAGAGGTIKAENVFGDYWLRTKSSKDRVGHVDYFNGKIITENIGIFLSTVNEKKQLRPVLHLDLTKTDLWRYAGKVKQDGTQTAPDASASPAVPTQKPETIPGVTMAPGQMYPQNPIVNEEDLKKNTWDCIYFGKYYNTKITPSVLAEAGEHDTVKEDEKKESYLVRHEQGYFRYEPVKWRVLSINEDGTDAFVMADEIIDVTPYYRDSNVQVTWEKSDVRKWLNGKFMETAFTAEEQAAVETTDVTTADNQWSNEPGGNDTKDKIYLPSIEEMLNPFYGFSNDAEESVTRTITITDYTNRGGTPNQPPAGFVSYWLRSPGVAQGCPAQVGDWGEGRILTESSVMIERAASYLGVRPVMHVDLSDTSLWTYAGQVTPTGVVVPKEEEPASTPDRTAQPEQPTSTPTPTPGSTVQPVLPTQNPQTAEPEVKKPGRAAIKKLNNKKGKKVTVTLSGNVSGVAGYQVAYAAKASMKGQKSRFFKGTTVTVKGLKKKKKYYFRVRAYCLDGTKKVYGAWSSTKNIKIKK